jgi:sarcosine oxidase, subunit delta
LLRIPCPYCGVRDESEFVFGGPSHIARPANDVDDATWTAYLFSLDNPAGAQFERWLHAYGCARWFNLVRDTLTHEIRMASLIGAPKADLGQRS